jgi:hypothetical protein
VQDYEELKQLEDDLWEAADQLRANSRLTASEYAMPVLGLIFLRHATTRFNALLPTVEEGIPARASGALREERVRLGFQGKAAIYLPETARYDYLAALPASTNVGEAIRDAMMAIEESVTDQNGNKLLAGALPKDYLGLERDLLAELLKIFNSPLLASARGDVFGRIYEYFLNQFAQSGAQEGGEFFTPPSLVRMIVNVIEPDHGTVLDPACGSAGMFVQTGHFIEDARQRSMQEVDITFYGQEKADLNSKLARMNLAVHGLEGNIRIGNTFYEDHHQLLGKCDFVMASSASDAGNKHPELSAGQQLRDSRPPHAPPPALFLPDELSPIAPTGAAHNSPHWGWSLSRALRVLPVLLPPQGGEGLAAERARELAAKTRNQLQAIERTGVTGALKGALLRGRPPLTSSSKLHAPLLPVAESDSWQR